MYASRHIHVGIPFYHPSVVKLAISVKRMKAWNAFLTSGFLPKALQIYIIIL